MSDTRAAAPDASYSVLKSLIRIAAGIAFVSFLTDSAQAQSTRTDTQYPLQIVHPLETIADLQRQLDQLEAELKKVASLVDAAGNRILIQNNQAVNSAGGAGAAALGALLANRTDYQEMRKTAADAVAALKGCVNTVEQVPAALQSRQMDQALRKAAEALDLAQKSVNKWDDAYSQFKSILNRIITEGRVVTGTATPKQATELAKELAERLGKTRPEFSKAAKDLSELGQAMDDSHEALSKLPIIRTQIEQLTDSITQISLVPPAPALPLPPDGLPPGPDPNTPSGAGLPPTGTDPNSAPGAIQHPGGTDPNAQPSTASSSTETDPGIGTFPVTGTDGGMPAGADPNTPPNVPPDSGPKTPNTTSSNGWCNGDLALCEAWRDGGDRAAFGDPPNSDAVATATANAARQQFYGQNPQLKQFQEPAAYRSPADELNDAIQKGLLNNSSGTMADNSGQSSGTSSRFLIDSLPTTGTLHLVDDLNLPMQLVDVLTSSDTNQSTYQALPGTTNFLTRPIPGISQSQSFSSGGSPPTKTDWWNVFLAGLQMANVGIRTYQALHPRVFYIYRPAQPSVVSTQNSVLSRPQVNRQYNPCVAPDNLSHFLELASKYANVMAELKADTSPGCPLGWARPYGPRGIP